MIRHARIPAYIALDVKKKKYKIQNRAQRLPLRERPPNQILSVRAKEIGAKNEPAARQNITGTENKITRLSNNIVEVVFRSSPRAADFWLSLEFRLDIKEFV